MSFFLFSHCKSMATLSYHTNQSFCAIAKKNTKFVNAYTNTKHDISAKSQPYVPCSKEMISKDILPVFLFVFFCFVFLLLVAMATIKIRAGQQSHLPGRGPFKEHF